MPLRLGSSTCRPGVLGCEGALGFGVHITSRGLHCAGTSGAPAAPAPATPGPWSCAGAQTVFVCWGFPNPCLTGLCKGLLPCAGLLCVCVDPGGLSCVARAVWSLFGWDASGVCCVWWLIFSLKAVGWRCWREWHQPLVAPALVVLQEWHQPHPSPVCGGVVGAELCPRTGLSVHVSVMV